MTVFDPKEQNQQLDHKIVAGLERLSHAFRVLLWEKATQHGMSPIQIQLLLFIGYHSSDKNNVSYLAREFNLTKPTISDVLKTLERKKLITRLPSSVDGRRHQVALTVAGEKVVADTALYTAPFSQWVAGVNGQEKEQLWQMISDLIRMLNRANIISIQRCCYNCQYYGEQDDTPFCHLLNQSLWPGDIRIDCPEHIMAEGL